MHTSHTSPPRPLPSHTPLTPLPTLTCPQEDAPKPLVGLQSRSVKDDIPKLGDDGLKDDLHYHHREEDPVAEESFKHVSLAVDCACVDLVKELHEHKHVEDERVVLSGDVTVKAVVDIKQSVTSVEDHQGNEELVD